jgi:hypothetical protein
MVVIGVSSKRCFLHVTGVFIAWLQAFVKEATAAVYEAIGLWVYSHDYRYVGSCREVYLHNDEQFRGQEEIQFPVEKA